MNATLQNWFELTRISNLPTVLSSTLVGIFMLMPLVPNPMLIFGVVLPIILAIACFYIGGFVMNILNSTTAALSQLLIASVITGLYIVSLHRPRNKDADVYVAV